MNKTDDTIPCRLTGPDGKVLLSGTIADLRRDAQKLRELDLLRKAREGNRKSEEPE